MHRKKKIHKIMHTIVGINPVDMIKFLYSSNDFILSISFISL